MSSILSKLINLAGNITGTLGLANGGTSATTKAGAFDALSPMTTAGDVIYGGTSGTGTRLAPGSSTQLFHGGTTPSWSQVVDADVSSTAAIDATKIVGDASGNAVAIGKIGERVNSAALTDTSAGTFDSSVNCGTIVLNKGVYLVVLHSVSTSPSTTHIYTNVSISSTSATHDPAYFAQDVSTAINVNRHLWVTRYVLISSNSTTLYWVGTINGTGGANGTFKGAATGSILYAVRAG